MGYRIGLDLGISSIGWACVEDKENGEPKRIIDLGTRIFDRAENPKDGAPLAAPRREARELRRRLRRRNHRIKRTKILLEKYDIISQQEIEKMYENYNFPNTPYELRVIGLDNKLTNKELARVLISLVKKRGYKSNSKSEESNDKETGKLLTATKDNENLMKEKGYRSVAEMYLKDEKFKMRLPNGQIATRIDKNTGKEIEIIKIKNSINDYKNTPLRKLLVEEIKLILNKQKEYNPKITDQFINEYLNIFNSQRNFDEGPGEPSPYAGNQIEKMLGKCTFEREEYRAPKSTYTFEYFKLLQDLNHIKIIQYELKQDNEIVQTVRTLTEEERKKLIELAKKTPTLNYYKIRKEIKLKENERFNMCRYKSTREFTDDVNKEAESDNKKIKEFQSYHEIRKALDKYKKEYIQKLSTNDLDNIGYALCVYKNDKKRIEYIKTNVKQIPDEVINYLLPLSFSKVGNLSLKAMKKTIPYLEKGLTYDKAVNELGKIDSNYSDFRGLVNTEKRRKLSINNLEENISNPVVRRAVSQTIKVLNAITLKYNSIYGKPDLVVVELARELGKSFKERQSIEKIYEENRTRNEKAIQEIRELGKTNVTGKDIVKYKLWKDQNEICIYSGKHIKVEDLFTDAVDIDHIIPYSQCFDDTYKNKVLVLASENRQKGNRTAYKYIKEAGKNLEEYEVRVNNYIKDYRKKERLLKADFSTEDAKNWKDRNIEDTQYISRLVYKLINNYMEFSDNPNVNRKVRNINGAVTHYIRNRLGIEKIRADGDEHHAVDACIIATTSNYMVNKITRYSQYIDGRFMNDRGEYVDIETGEIINKEDYEEEYGPKFPEPWEGFRRELEIRSSDDVANRAEKTPEELKKIMVQEINDEIKKGKLYSYIEHDDGINRFDDLEPIFVSRMPRRKVKGQAHMETIRGIEKENGKLKTITKTPLTKLKLDDNNEIKNYSKKAKQDDKLLYDALVEQLKKFDGKGEEAFKEPFFKPKKDGSKGPIVNTVKIEENATLGVEFKEGKAFAGNGNMVRIDVFYVEGEGYYFVPIYVADTIKKELPNKACVANKETDKWKTMDDKNFIFSLYPNDLIYIESEKGIKLNGNNDNKKEQIELKKLFAYYVKAGISVAQITIDNQDGEYTQPSLGIKGLKKIEKYDIDVLGNYHKIKLPEKRIKFNIN